MNQYNESGSYNIDNNANMEDDTQHIHNEQNLKELNEQQDLKVNINNNNNNTQCTNSNNSSNFIEFCVGSYTCLNFSQLLICASCVYKQIQDFEARKKIDIFTQNSYKFILFKIFSDKFDQFKQFWIHCYAPYVSKFQSNNNNYELLFNEILNQI